MVEALRTKGLPVRVPAVRGRAARLPPRREHPARARSRAVLLRAASSASRRPMRSSRYRSATSHRNESMRRLTASLRELGQMLRIAVAEEHLTDALCGIDRCRQASHRPAAWRDLAERVFGSTLLGREVGQSVNLLVRVASRGAAARRAHRRTSFDLSGAPLAGNWRAVLGHDARRQARPTRLAGNTASSAFAVLHQRHIPTGSGGSSARRALPFSCRRNSSW